MSKGASCGCPLNTVSNGDSSQQIARTMVANVAKLSPSPPFLHSSTPSSSQTQYAIKLSRDFKAKMILKHAEYIMSKAFECKALRSSQGLGDLESAIATNNGEPITRPNIIIVIFWVHHETKYLYCHFSGKHQILFSLDFLSLSVLILCLMIQRTQRKASIGYDILFANSRDIYVLQGSGYKKISLFRKLSNLQNKLIVHEDGTVRLALDLDWGAWPGIFIKGGFSAEGIWLEITIVTIEVMNRIPDWQKRVAGQAQSETSLAIDGGEGGALGGRLS